MENHINVNLLRYGCALLWDKYNTESQISQIQFSNNFPDSKVDLSFFLKNAYNKHIFGGAAFYIVFDRITHEVVMYFALKAGCLIETPNETAVKIKSESMDHEFDELRVSRTISGIELMLFAMNSDYALKKKTSHLGSMLYWKFIYPTVKKISRETGASYFYLYAVDQNLIKYYEKLNFKRASDLMPVKPDFDSECIYMSQKLL